MFLGEYRLKFSGSGRILLPKKIREEAGGMEVILSRGLDGGIWGYSKRLWEEEAQKQLMIPISKIEGRDLRRFLFSAAEEVRFDEQGRIVIPKTLISYAQLRNEVMVVGAGDHFEIWDKDTWKNIINKITERKLPDGKTD